jgi:hypothetical protein
MLLRFKKTRDGCVLTCIRADGSVEVQRSSQSAFFAIHDLLHYALETTLGMHQAFLGLLASGWSFHTFEDHADPRYQSMPAEALVAEHLVAILSRHFSGGAWEDPELLPLWAEEINTELAIELAKADAPSYRATPEQLAAVCRRHLELGTQWTQVSVGEHLELEFAEF